MPNKNRFNFTQTDRETGKIQNVGYIDLKESDEAATLYFYGDIVSTTWDCWCMEDKCPQDIADFICSIDNEKPMKIYFNSGGGNVFAGMAIHNILKRHKGYKEGFVDGIAASIATVIMFACDTLTFSSGAQSMIHKPICGCYGNADRFLQIIDELDKCEESMLDIYESRAKEGITREQIKEMVDRETWFTGEGFANYFNVEVADKPAIAACASGYFGMYDNAPEEHRNNTGIVDEVTKKVKSQEIEAAKKALLDDLYMYGI